MNDAEIREWLVESEPSRIQSLLDRADGVRLEHKGAAVLIRGLLEVGNACSRSCHYCGLRRENSSLPRYTMSDAEILTAVETVRSFGHRTVVIQGGESSAFSRERVGRLVRSIKSVDPDFAITLSLGERTPETLTHWRRMGADRYLLKFETSDERLYARIHPSRPGGVSSRFPLLATLRELGYEVGSGIMVGLPGQSIDSVVTDLRTMAELRLAMVAVGPFVPHPDTPLGRGEAAVDRAVDAVANTPELTLKVLALTRLLLPDANIPATTALSAVDTEGYEKALRAGANVIMHNLTPLRYKPCYEVYELDSRKDDHLAGWRRIEQAVAACGRQTE